MSSVCSGWAEVTAVIRRATGMTSKPCSRWSAPPRSSPSPTSSRPSATPIRKRGPGPDGTTRSAGATVLIAERHGEPLGFVSVAQDRLEALFVLPEEWGRGVADDLHERALRRLRQLTGEARLWVQERNHRARRFYERRGWGPDGRRSVAPHPPYRGLLGYNITLSRGCS